MSTSKNGGLKYIQNSGFSCTGSTENRYINDWWQDLDKKLVTVWHIKEFLFDPHKGNWVTPQQSPKNVQVVNPSLSRISSELVELSFSDENGTVQKIESPCIDIDFEKQCLLLWTTPFELYIFHYD